MKKIILVIGLVFIAFLATSFEELVVGRTEIENLYPIILGGLDKSNKSETGGYLITTVSPSTEEEAKKPDVIMTIAGKTAFEANRLIGTYAENDIYWGHTQYILIGEEASKEDIFKYLDFFMRDNEPRITITPLVIMGASSQEVITRLYEQNISITKTVTNIIDNFGLTSYSSSMKFIEFINLMAPSQDGYLPCLALKVEDNELTIEHSTEEVQKGEFDKENQSEDKDYVLHSPGYALIKDGKVIDHLVDEQGRGLSWIINKIVSGVIIVEYEGVKYNLEITKGNSQIKPEIKGNQLEAEIKVNVHTIITEMSQQNTVIDNELINKLQSKLGEVVEKEVTEVIETAQKHEIDILGIGDAVHHRYPVKWEKKYKEQWDDLFHDVDIKVTVDPTIERSARFYESILIKEAK